MPHDVLQRAVAAPYRETFFPLGEVLEVESNDPRAVECARGTFGHFPPAPGSGWPVRLRLLLDPGIHSGPPWPQPVYRASGDLLAITLGGNFAFADVEQRYAQGHFSDALLADPEVFRWAFLYGLVYVPLIRHLFTPLHAACVVRDGRGFCLSGPSGAGKTCLAYFCGRNGYQVLAEDAVYVTRAEPIRLRGSAPLFHFTADSVRLFPELVQYPVALDRNGEDCLVVPTPQLGLRWLAGECSPGAVVFLQRGAGRFLERLPVAEVVEALYDTLPLDRPDVMQSHRRTLELLAACGAYRLGYQTLEEGIELLNRL